MVHHNELLAVVGFRIIALVGVVMIAYFVPKLARSYGRDPSVAFVLAVLNPLILLHLVAGAHNDALMLGFLVAGLWFAREGRPLLGLLLCTVGAMVKIPAFIGVVYIGWCWLGDDVPWRARVKPTALACLLLCRRDDGGVSDGRARLGLGVRARQSGHRPLLDRPTDGRRNVGGQALEGARPRRAPEPAALGLPATSDSSWRRRSGCVCSGSARGSDAMRSMGLTLLAVVFLGPTVQPWYVAWCVVILATIAEHRLRVLVIFVSCLSCYFGLPGARKLVVQFGEAKPIFIVLASIALLVLLAIPIVIRVRRALAPEPMPTVTLRAALAPERPLEEQLQDGDVDPAAELAADLAFDADEVEAARLVDRDRGRLGGAHAGDDRVEAVGSRHDDGLGEQFSPDPLAAAVGRDVDGVLDGGGIAGSGPVGRERGEADHRRRPRRRR